VNWIINKIPIEVIKGIFIYICEKENTMNEFQINLNIFTKYLSPNKKLNIFFTYTSNLSANSEALEENSVVIYFLVKN
jgi:hypothetical protein